MIYSHGNKKIGKDTLIINIHTSTNCPAKDMCLLRGKCYAAAAERLRKSVLPFRERQERLWNAKPAQYFIDELLYIKSNALQYVRWQEAGDIANQADLDKMSEIAEGVKGKYVCYTYSCRHDLDFSKKSDNLIVTGSYFMVDNMFVPLNKKEREQLPKGTLFCPGNCRGCSLCKTPGQKIIYQGIH